ncbi:erythromycin esterase family protein [Pseudoduganella sp. LjRoot289]|uniref:erythromycin esterase family protein n=1 Tax=Pseudoduganella sp. LjRoot289 TaxID=3342314 RepID=UPI003ED14979
MHIHKAALASLALAAATAAPACAAAPWPVATVQAEQEDDSDLQSFADAIGKARIVALGEQTHGAREEYLLKTRLLKFLHQKMGFDVLLLESGFYDIARLAERVERGEKLDDIAPGNVFFMYANSAEGRGMLRYVDQQRALGRPMALGGIDSQHTGALSKAELLTRLQAYLHTTAPALANGAAWRQYARTAQPLLEMQRTPPSSAEQAAFRQHAAALKDALCASGPAKPPEPQGAAFWCQTVKSVDAQAASYWSADHDYQRDNQMGDNAIWLADRLYPGRKVVIWAHTVHVARGFQRTPAHLQAGEVMHRHWGQDYKVVQFSGAGGEILDFATMSKLPLPAIAPDSLEAALAAKAGGANAVLGLAGADAAGARPQFSYEYGTHSGARLGVNWDVLFFIRNITPVSMSR